MSSKPSLAQAELDALCEKTLIVHVGQREVEVHPPTLAQLNAAAPLWGKLIAKVEERGEKVKENVEHIKSKEAKSEGFDASHAVETILKNMYAFIDDLFPIFLIYLAPRGKELSDFTDDELRVGLDIGDMKRILIFIREGVELGDLLKNAVLPVSQVEEEPATPTLTHSSSKVGKVTL